MKTTENIPTYHTLEEIRMRKDQLDDALEQDHEKLALLWNGLFKQNENATKGEYVASLVTKTITAVDAFLLMRKLMKNYSHLFSFVTKRKKKK